MELQIIRASRFFFLKMNVVYMYLYEISVTLTA